MTAENVQLLRAEPRLIAHHLPQFHPTAQNDAWWGKGFTEWANVTKAKPLFKGHAQPHLPADLGFYDLRLPEARHAQAELAKEYGLGGFMYYHYWFSGTRILERPVQEILSSGEPDFPFCLCWANESWSRRWDGRENELLIRQEYSEEDIRNHCAWLADAFKDRRYIKVGTRPVFVIYRYHHIPQELDLLGRMRESLARLNCTDPYFVASNAHAPWHDFREAGFDNVLDFQPSFGRLRGVDDPRRRTVGRLLRNVRLGELNAKLRLYDYELACLAMEPPGLPFETIPCVAVGWDNSPRRQARAAVFVNHTPAAFGSMLERRLELWSASKPSTDLFFVNAWTEWAEGNYLEPDVEFGRGFLEALALAVERFRAGSTQLAAPTIPHSPYVPREMKVRPAHQRTAGAAIRT
jgi:hypothetical protein